MDIIARFSPDIHFAWLAALGGQFLVWEQNARAFLFSEGKQSVNAFLGSPAVTQASDVLAQMLAAAPPQLVLGVGTATDRYTAPKRGEPPGHNINAHVAYIPIVLAGGAMPRDSALALYRESSAPGAAEREWKTRVAHQASLITTGLRVRSPDTLLNRPGFGWFFGGDASINSFAMNAVGQSALVRDGALRFFARDQRADGKITHEICQGAGHVDWFSYPYPFYHGDTSPFWILAFGEYWKQTDDVALLKELWPNLKKAYDWSLSTDKNGDGLMENPSAGAGALEVGALQIGILSDIYMSGVWVAALERFARMATAVGDASLAAQASAVHAKALSMMEAKLWMPAQGPYAFALLQDGSVNASLTAWTATAMAFGVLDQTRGVQMAATLATSNIMTDWGARPLSASSALFDPLPYNNGAVWPFVTGFVSLAQYQYHNASAGTFALDAIVRTTFDHALGRNPEVISGRLYKPLDTAVPQQFFATSMVLTPLIRGLPGIDVDAPRRTIRIAPQLPTEWDSVVVDNVPVGPERASFVVRREHGAMHLAVVRANGAERIALRVIFAPAMPLGSVVEGDQAMVQRTDGDIHAAMERFVVERAILTVRYADGWSIVVPTVRPAIGARSTAMRVLSERMVKDQYIATLEGLAGSTHTVQLRTPSSRGVLRSISVTFPASGANADGYTSTTITLSRDTP